MKLFVAAIISLCLCSCASVIYESNGTKITYSRFFAGADSINVKVGEARAEINGQKIDTATLNSILNLLGVVK